MSGSDAPVYDVARILGVLPHRYPLLLVDRVISLDLGERIHAVKAVTFNEQFFQGHFPGRPIMPGVMQIEAMAQVAAILGIETLELAGTGKLVYFMSIENAKFRHVVTPGDTLELHVTVIRGRGKIWKFRGEARVGDTLCAEAEFAAMILSEEEASAKG